MLRDEEDDGAPRRARPSRGRGDGPQAASPQRERRSGSRAGAHPARGAAPRPLGAHHGGNASAPRSLGDHVLVDEEAVRRIVDAAELRRDETVLDVGAGAGALAKECRRRGARVTAIEVQPNHVRQLRSEGFDVIAGDALQVGIPRVDAVVANPPFGIAAPLLFRLLDAGFKRAILVLPSEFTHRMLAKPGTDAYGRLTVQAALRWKTTTLFHLRRWVFDPPPEVPCVVARVEPAPTPGLDVALLGKVLEHAWASKRKTLRHGLGNLATDLRISSGKVTQALRDLDLEDRPALEATPQEYADLVRALR